MNWKLTERIVAAAVFLYAFVLYVLTVAPTASFWDSGEFIAIANQLQVSHPPGAPFYMLVGRLFSMFVPLEYISLAVNMVSVLASALTILLTHLIIVRLVREWQGKPSAWTAADRISALAGGVIGAVTFAATDSFWFNAVEAEVYALSMFFTAIVVWLILKWKEQAAHEEAMLKGGLHPFGLAANRYLILIAYMFGLAIGVHLLNLLALFFIALIFFYAEIEKADWTPQQTWTGIVVTGIVATIAFVTVYPGVIQILPDFAGQSGVPVLFVLAVLTLVVFAIYYTHSRQMQAANLVALSLAMVLIGYSTYSLIFIRSAADPPIDENDPETTEAIVSYLKREQYGQTPLLRGASWDNRTNRLDENNEKLFPRRWSPDPNHGAIYSQYDSDGEFFWQYQVGWMYWRYFMWNFVGKASDMQDAPAYAGFSEAVAEQHYFQTPSERAGQNAYYGLPLLLGLIGLAFHFMKDWRRAFAVSILFFVSGIGIILYLNQTPLQPRERDYSYVASFFAFSLWIGIGATGIIQLIAEAMKQRGQAVNNGILLGVTGLLVLIPAQMMVENYDDHDRSGRYVAPEYAYNMLMSLDEDAIVFTNGDNDTFPLWYLQEVEETRRDVRVVNLSLLNTPWYVNQLKTQQARDSAPLPISMSDEQIRDLQIQPWRPSQVEIPVDKQLLLSQTEVFIPMEDTSNIESPMVWDLPGRPYSDQFNLLYGADQAALDILHTNATQGWERPVYFAVTVSPDGQLNLQDYFQLEGQAFRVLPIKDDEPSPLGRVNPDVTMDRLREFRFTNLSDPDVYYDENIRRMVDNYRNIFSHTAEQAALAGRLEEARELLNTFHEQVPFETIPGDIRSFSLMAQAFQALGDDDKAVEIMKKAEPVALHDLSQATSNRDMNMAATFVQMIRMTYLQAQDFAAASAFTCTLADTLEDPSYCQDEAEVRAEFEQMQRFMEEEQ